MVQFSSEINLLKYAISKSTLDISFNNTFNIDIDLEDLLNDTKDKDKSIELDAKNIMSFDSDILDYGYSYEDIANNMSDI